MASVVIGSHTADVPDEALTAMEGYVGRFPAYHGNVAEWIRDWIKGTLVSLANADHTQAAQDALADSTVEINAMFKKKA